MVSKAFRANKNEVVDSNSGKTNETIMNLSRNLTYMPNIRAIKELIFLTSNAKKTFNNLREAFIKAPIFQHFVLKSYIQIEIGV